MDEQIPVYRLGAVIKTNDILAMVVGYDFIENKERLAFAYRIVPYPIGYVGNDKLALSDQCELVENGYLSEFSESASFFMGICKKVSETVSADEMKGYLNDVFYRNEVDSDERSTSDW